MMTRSCRQTTRVAAVSIALVASTITAFSWADGNVTGSTSEQSNPAQEARVVAIRIDPHGHRSGAILADGTDRADSSILPRGGGPVAIGADGMPVPYARVDDASSLERIAMTGHVRMMLHSPSGSPTGFVMDDGTQVFTVPAVADAVAQQVAAGQTLRVEGRGTRTAEGTGMWAMTITRPSNLVLLDMNRGIGAPELNLR